MGIRLLASIPEDKLSEVEKPEVIKSQSNYKTEKIPNRIKQLCNVIHSQKYFDGRSLITRLEDT